MSLDRRDQPALTVQMVSTVQTVLTAQTAPASVIGAVLDLLCELEDA